MTGQQNDGFARMESKLDRFVEQYQIDMNGEGDKPGIKTALALQKQRVDNHSRDIERIRQEQSKRTWWAIGVATSLGLCIGGLAIDKLFGSQSTNQQNTKQSP